MRPGSQERRPRRRTVAGLGLAAALLFTTGGGCLDEPEVEERWTRLDLVRSSLTAGQAVGGGQVVPVQVRSEVVFRRILTGFAVCELRGSETLGPGSLVIDPRAPREAMAASVDQLLANSVSLGRATRAVTGWDHLIQGIDFAFSAQVPATLPSGAPPVGVYLVCYLGSGVEVERADGSDTLLVTPFPSAPYEILPIGMSLSLATPGSP